MNRREKELVVSELNKKIEGYQAVVLTHYRGLNVEQMNQLRRRLREEKIYYRVVKNTLIKMASKGTDLEKLHPYFEGPTALAISYGDPAHLVKILTEFVKTQPALEIKVGLVQGKVVNTEEIKALASLPPRNILFAQILGGIQAPGGQIAGAMMVILQQVLGVIQSRVDQLSKSESGIS